MATLSNAQTVAADQVAEHYARSRRFARASLAEALKCGADLCEAKATAPHGTWLSFLKRAGIPERQAQRLMKLAASGLKPDTVSDLGGIREALRLLAWRSEHDLEGWCADDLARTVIDGRVLRRAARAGFAPSRALSAARNDRDAFMAEVREWAGRA